MTDHNQAGRTGSSSTTRTVAREETEACGQNVNNNDLPKIAE